MQTPRFLASSLVGVCIQNWASKCYQRTQITVEMPRHPGLSRCDWKVLEMLGPWPMMPRFIITLKIRMLQQFRLRFENPANFHLSLYYHHGASGCGDWRQLRSGSCPCGEAGQQAPGLCGDAQFGEERLPDGGSFQGSGRGEFEASGVGCEHCNQLVLQRPPIFWHFNSWFFEELRMMIGLCWIMLDSYPSQLLGGFKSFYYIYLTSILPRMLQWNLAWYLHWRR